MPQHTLGGRATLAFRCMCHSTLQVTCHTCLQVHVLQHTSGKCATTSFRCTYFSTLQVNVPNLPLRARAVCLQVTWYIYLQAHVSFFFCLQVHVPHLTSVHVSLLPSGACATYPIRCTCHTFPQAHVPHLL